ncbi:MAG: xanthine dehydrogenase molybdopterin binding subunit [Oligoflexia bacterium]|nr:xanthine dehydrogenase molybdopterin binding subunit [Oligoflexia bacterium]
MSFPSPLHQPGPHDSAVGHVTGRARYVDDLLDPPGLLHGVLVRANTARGKLQAINTATARAMPGVAAVLTARDIPGHPTIGPVQHDELLLATDQIAFNGQAVALVLAQSRDQARVAAQAVTLTVDPLPAVLDIDDAIAAGRFHGTPHVIARGDIETALSSAPIVVRGEVRTGGQDHFYLETQAALAIPDDAGNIKILASTQHPTEAQKMSARVLGIGAHRVCCEVPRMGGGFGGKESQSTAFACLAALGAHLTGHPCRIRLTRQEDMATTGGRHPFLGRYTAGFDTDGRLLALDASLYCDGGWTLDLSHAILDRALFHLDNAYFIEHCRLQGQVCHTNKPTNTAFRGFGGPQGIAVVEDAFRRAARVLRIPAEHLRRRSYYGAAPRDQTPYGQQVPAPRIAAMHDRLVQTADLSARRQQITDFNAQSTWCKRGISLQPLKFGISFTAALLNQAGALALVYADGTVQLNHGGTEMGQGLHTKMRAVACDVLGVGVDAIRVMSTSTEKVPNTSPTAASSGSDLNGQAVRAACETVRARMLPAAASALGCEPSAVRFAGGRVLGPDGNSLAFSSLAQTCWAQQISLSSTGYYATPNIHYDRDAGRGEPFFYFAYGVALVEVELHGLTGEHRVRRVDILHDVGDSLVPSIDLGQIEGGFIQGLGWLTAEQVCFDASGAVSTRGPSTYKIPTIGDVPLDFRVSMLEHQPQPGTIGGSKAVGEPPFMLAIGVIGALEEAIAAFGDGPLALTLPATPEALLRAVEAARGA